MENFISVGQFARRIRDVFGDDPRFRYFFHHIARLGGPNDECITIVSEQDQKEIEAHLWDASGLSRPPGEDETYVCYAAKGNSLVIRSTGRLAKCTVALNDSCNDIGWISENGEIRVDQAKYQRWIAPLVEADWENVGCPLPSVMQQWSQGERAYLPRLPFGQSALMGATERPLCPRKRTNQQSLQDVRLVPKADSRTAAKSGCVSRYPHCNPATFGLGGT